MSWNDRLSTSLHWQKPFDYQQQVIEQVGDIRGFGNNLHLEENRQCYFNAVDMLYDLVFHLMKREKHKKIAKEIKDSEDSYSRFMIRASADGVFSAAEREEQIQHVKKKFRLMMDLLDAEGWLEKKKGRISDV